MKHGNNNNSNNNNNNNNNDKRPHTLSNKKRPVQRIEVEVSPRVNGFRGDVASVC